ncbi:hypothetical protein GCM10020218_009470 [Dactylosporangium vinaceum]
MMIRTRSGRSVPPASSRSAATGGMREARRAGTYAASRVTVTPMTSGTQSAVAGMTRPLAGSCGPIAPSRSRRPIASSTPPPTPSTEPSTPKTVASPRIRRITWPRLAPTARSRAISRIRCVTSIENVLKMMNELTRTAMRANASRNVCSRVMTSLTEAASSSMACWPVMASSPAGSLVAIASRSRVWVTPALACTWISP